MKTKHPIDQKQEKSRVGDNILILLIGANLLPQQKNNLSQEDKDRVEEIHGKIALSRLVPCEANDLSLDYLNESYEYLKALLLDMEAKHEAEQRERYEHIFDDDWLLKNPPKGIS